MTKKTYAKALALLTRRDYAVSELKHKLLQKGHHDADVAAVMKQLLDADLLNDDRFVENFIRQKMRKGHGPMRVKQDLRRFEIEKNITEIKALAEDEWCDAIKRTWQKRFKGKPPGNMRERAEQIRFLMYRGYTQEQIETLMNVESDS